MKNMQIDFNKLFLLHDVILVVASICKVGIPKTNPQPRANNMYLYHTFEASGCMIVVQNIGFRFNHCWFEVVP